MTCFLASYSESTPIRTTAKYHHTWRNKDRVLRTECDKFQNCCCFCSEICDTHNLNIASDSYLLLYTWQNQKIYEDIRRREWKARAPTDIQFRRPQQDWEVLSLSLCSPPLKKMQDLFPISYSGSFWRLILDVTVPMTQSNDFYCLLIQQHQHLDMTC